MKRRTKTVHRATPPAREGLTLERVRDEWRWLRETLPEVESSRQRYADLFDFAPVGYLTLDRNGFIRDINLTGARLLGRERGRLVGGPLMPLIAAADRRKYLNHLSRLRRGQTHASTEVAIANHSDAPTAVHLVSVPVDENVHTLFRTAMVDITERRRVEQALLENQQRLAGIVNSAMDAIISVDADQRIMLFNGAAEQMFGYRAAEVLGQPLTRLMPERFRQGHAQHVHQFGQTGVTGRRMDALGQISGLRANGEEFPIEASISQTQVAGRPVFTVILRDITERQQAEEQLRRLNRTLRAYSRSDQALLRLGDQTAYLAEVCKIIVEDCGHAMVWVGLAESDEAKSIRPVACAGLAAGDLETLQLTWADTVRGRGPTGTAIRTGQVCQCRNMLTDPQFAPWRAEAIKRGYAASIALPLLAEGRAFGALTIDSPVPDPFSEEEVKLLTELANDVAYGLTMLRLRAGQAAAEAALRDVHQLLEARVEQRTAELRAANQRLSRLIRQRQRLEKELLDVSEREQQRIGQDLHDSLGQELSGLAFSMEALEHRLTQRNLPESAEAAKLAGRTKQLIGHTRHLAKGLFPVELKTRGLVPALNTLAASTEEMFQIACRVRIGEAESEALPAPARQLADGDSAPAGRSETPRHGGQASRSVRGPAERQAEQPWAALDESQARQLYRIAQQAVGNAAKHSRGKRIEIRLARRWGCRVLSVSDDGVGLPEDGPPKGHLGLDVMKHRARLIGARLRVKPRRHGGTTVICLLPPRRDNDEHKDPEKIR